MRFSTLLVCGLMLLAVASVTAQTVFNKKSGDISFPARFAHATWTTTSTANNVVTLWVSNGRSSVSSAAYLTDTWRSVDQGVTWTQVSDASPWGLGEMGAVIIPTGAASGLEVVKLGGVTTTTYYDNNLYVSQDGGATWAAPTTNVYESRAYASAVALSGAQAGKVILVAGLAQGTVLANVDVITVATGATVSYTNAAFSARHSAALLALTGNKLLLVGGTDRGLNALNDVWTSTDVGATWTQVTAAASFPARFQFGAVFRPEITQIMLATGAGSQYGVLYNTVYSAPEATPGTFSQVTTAAVHFSPRYLAGMVRDTVGNIFVVGGATAAGADTLPQSDVWMLDAIVYHVSDVTYATCTSLVSADTCATAGQSTNGQKAVTSWLCRDPQEVSVDKANCIAPAAQNCVLPHCFAWSTTLGTCMTTTAPIAACFTPPQTSQGSQPLNPVCKDTFSVTTVADTNCVAATKPATTQNCVLAQCSVIKGDPEFVGFRGQKYQIHGIPGSIFNILTSPHVQYNAEFVYLGSKSGRACNTTRTHPWTHPGTYLGQLGLQIGADKVHIQAGDCMSGIHSVTVNGRPMKVGTKVHFAEKQSLSFVDAYTMHFALKEVDIQLVNSDKFFNQEVSMTRFGERTHQLHGLLGQTWNQQIYKDEQGRKHFIEGHPNDYLVQEDHLFGTDFVFNKFATNSE